MGKHDAPPRSCRGEGAHGSELNTGQQGADRGDARRQVTADHILQGVHAARRGQTRS